MNLVLFCRLEDGLRAVGVLDAIREHPLLMREVFVGGEKPLTAEQLLGLFEIVSSHTGATEDGRRTEQLCSGGTGWLRLLVCYTCDCPSVTLMNDKKPVATAYILK